MAQRVRYLVAVVVRVLVPVVVLVLLQAVGLVVAGLCLGLLALLAWVGAAVVYLEVLGLLPLLVPCLLVGLLVQPARWVLGRRRGISEALPGR